MGIHAIDPSTADAVRERGADPIWGHPAVREPATGYGPCRSCLRTFDEGREDRVLFTHDSHAGTPFGLRPGPVFIHAERCEPWDGEGFPPGIAGLKLTFDARDGAGRTVALARSEGDGDGAAAALAAVAAHAGVEHVLVWNTEAGCFVCRATVVGGRC